MRKHYILWQFQDGITPQQIDAAFEHVTTLLGVVPGLLHLRNGENLSRRTGGYTHFSEMYFESTEALDAYYENEAHLTVAREHTIPITKRALTLDYDEA
jgi:hypothetical protein